jgi:endonuclease/exonuclease/phosphatase family metal-dependent hydrolase
MRLAVYNVENLFDRARVMNLATWSEGRPILEKYAELNQLLGEPQYTATMKQRMVRLLRELGLERSDTARFVILRRNRGKLLKRPQSGGVEITADGRADWAGSLELRDEPVDEEAMRNTARALRDVRADVMGIVEAEHRPGLIEFNRSILSSPKVGGAPFAHVMLIDGNDDRGIDVGLMTTPGYPISYIFSHVDDRLPDGTLIFSRDCPEFSIGTPSGEELVVMVNHFKSKGYGSQAASSERRRLQAARVAEIYEELAAWGVENVAVMGDLNDTPDSTALAPLLRETDLVDVFDHPRFNDGGYPGTYGLCNARDKIDYLLLSPALASRVTTGGVHRTAMWPGLRPPRWNVYPELRRKEDAGSDHAALWVDVAL